MAAEQIFTRANNGRELPNKKEQKDFVLDDVVDVLMGLRGPGELSVVFALQGDNLPRTLKTRRPSLCARAARVQFHWLLLLSPNPRG